MNFLPPSRSAVLDNLRLLAADWRASGGLARFFMLSQVLSCALMVVSAAGAVVAAVAGQQWAYLGLLATSAICFFQTLGTWTVLKQRFGVRHELL